MKRYIGKRLEEGCEVYVNEDGKVYPLPLRLDLENKSPTGFEWGYWGSGPAQLALAILADYFGPTPLPTRCMWCGERMDGDTCRGCGDIVAERDRYQRVFELFQTFKREMVSPIKEAMFTLEASDIEAWLEKQKPDLGGDPALEVSDH